MSDPNDVTLGELARGLVSLERRINEQFTGVQKRFDGLSFVPRDVYEVEMRTLRQEVEDVKEWKRWAVRALVGSFLLPILVALVVAVVLTR